MEDKYGQVYPERAVLPMRRLCEALLTSAVSRGGDSQTVVQAKALRGVLDGLEAEGFPEDEPLFLMRGQDELAAATVLVYANFVRVTPGAFGVGEQRQATIQRIEDCARRMKAWEPRKLPD